MPKINHNSRSLATSRGRKDTETNLLNYAKLKKEALEQKKEQLATQELKKCTFQPNVERRKYLTQSNKENQPGRAPQRAQKPKHNIHNKLYKYYGKKKRKECGQHPVYSFTPDITKSKESHRGAKIPQIPPTTPQTEILQIEEIDENELLNSMRSLFLRMDLDGDGKISAQQISLEKLSNDELDALTPFLIYLENTGVEIDYEQFYRLLSNSHQSPIKTLDPGQNSQLRA